MKTRQDYFLAAMMLITGSINTITTKYADRACAFGASDYPMDQSKKANPCEDRAQGEHQFNHPFVQALAMFVGEFACLVVFKLLVVFSSRSKTPVPVDQGNTNWSPLIFLPPALCDCIGTSTMYLGLTLTHASQFQMLRGSVVIFTGLLSKFWLGRQLTSTHWAGMFFVLIGLVFVGVAALFEGGSDDDASNPLLGDILIICAQVVVAIQMVIEEKFVGKYQVQPLQAVGWEGVFGMMIMSFLCVIFMFVPGPRAGNTFENINDAFIQIHNSWAITLAICGTIVSIAFFNYSGISVTKQMSATTRMVLDSVRTLTIWVYGLAVSWEVFSYFQVIGFVLLLTGTFVYNEILIVPILRRMGVMKPKVEEEEKNPLIN
eukprot:m.294595 g.294595  ORF g.294595 m.294595 type:complete len:375 (-) comp13028_c0_seq1:400-1524(-)